MPVRIGGISWSRPAAFPSRWRSPGMQTSETARRRISPSRFVAWWPVQRPDDVFVSGGPATRLEWARGLKDEPGDTHYREMVDKWSSRGFVVETGGDFFEVEGPAALIA